MDLRPFHEIESIYAKNLKLDGSLAQWKTYYDYSGK